MTLCDRAKVSFVCLLPSHPGKVHSVHCRQYSHAHGFSSLCAVACPIESEAPYYLTAAEEGVRWARGWGGETRRALQAAWLLRRSA